MPKAPGHHSNGQLPIFCACSRVTESRGRRSEISPPSVWRILRPPSPWWLLARSGSPNGIRKKVAPSCAQSSPLLRIPIVGACCHWRLFVQASVKQQSANGSLSMMRICLRLGCSSEPVSLRPKSSRPMLRRSFRPLGAMVGAKRPSAAKRPRHTAANDRQVPEADPLSVRLSHIRHLSGTPVFLAVGPTRAAPQGSAYGTTGSADVGGVRVQRDSIDPCSGAGVRRPARLRSTP